MLASFFYSFALARMIISIIIFINYNYRNKIILYHSFNNMSRKIFLIFLIKSVDNLFCFSIIVDIVNAVQCSVNL